MAIDDRTIRRAERETQPSPDGTPAGARGEAPRSTRARDPASSRTVMGVGGWLDDEEPDAPPAAHESAIAAPPSVPQRDPKSSRTVMGLGEQLDWEEPDASPAAPPSASGAPPRPCAP